MRQEWVLVHLRRLPQNGIEDLLSHQWKTRVFMNRDFFLPKPYLMVFKMHCLRNFLECFPIGDCIIALQFEWLALTFQERSKEILESLMSSTESTNQTTVKTRVSLGALPVTQSLECFKPSPSTVHRTNPTSLKIFPIMTMNIKLIFHDMQ